LILPKKHLATDRSLLYVGAEILQLLGRPRTTSGLWHQFKRYRSEQAELSTITYDWFILALDFLFALGVLTYEGGLLRRTAR